MLQSCTPTKALLAEPAFLLCEYANLGLQQRQHLLEVSVLLPAANLLLPNSHSCCDTLHDEKSVCFHTNV